MKIRKHEIPPEYQNMGGIKFEARFFTPSIYAIHQHLDRNDIFNPNSRCYIPKPTESEIEDEYRRLQVQNIQRDLYDWDPFAPAKHSLGFQLFNLVSRKIRSPALISKRSYTFGLFCAVASSIDLYERTGISTLSPDPAFSISAWAQHG